MTSAGSAWPPSWARLLGARVSPASWIASPNCAARQNLLHHRALRNLNVFFPEHGIAALEDLEGIKVEHGLGRFLRSLTELNRYAAKKAFSSFIAEQQLTAGQLKFLARVIDALTETGFVDPKNFFESPFTDIDSQGIVGVFPKERAKQIIQIVKALNTVEAA